MSSLVYHPAYDPYGAILRSVRILLICDEAIEKDKLRILDFVLLFPEFVQTMSLTSNLRGMWKRGAFLRRFPYEERPSAGRLFGLMGPSFEAAFQTLAAKQFIRRSSDVDDGWTLQVESVPAAVLELAEVRNGEEKYLMDFIHSIRREFQMEGPKGLKARSGLMEFRYDLV